MPSTYDTENGQEKNYRLDAIKADYLLHTIEYGIGSIPKGTILHRNDFTVSTKTVNAGNVTTAGDQEGQTMYTTWKVPYHVYTSSDYIPATKDSTITWTAAEYTGSRIYTYQTYTWDYDYVLGEDGDYHSRPKKVRGEQLTYAHKPA